MESTSAQTAGSSVERSRTRQLRLLRAFLLCRSSRGGNYAGIGGSRHQLCSHRAPEQHLGHTISSGEEPESRRTTARQFCTHMNIYPAVDILKGKAVRLKQGRADDVTIYGEPLEMAQRWFDAGAHWLHVVDLDGAFGGAPANHEVIARIARALPKLRVQVGGGIRSMAVIESLFAAGVQRAVLGTSAVNNPKFTSEALKRYGDRIAIGIDARDGIARVSGWTETSQIGAIDLARKLEQEGAKLVIYTDISRDGVLVGPNTES